MKSAGIASAIAAAVVLALAFSTSPFAQKAEEAARPPARTAAAQKPARAGAGHVSTQQRYGTTVAELRLVEGNVLVSQRWGLSAAGEKQRLDDRSRVITTANSRALVVYDDGCEVTVEANQRLEIENLGDCPARIAQAESIFEAGEVVADEMVAGEASNTSFVGAAVGSIAAPTGVGGGALATGGVVGVGTLVRDREGNVVSPS